MKRILILPCNYPPCNHISAQRPKSFAETFSKHGLYPVVVTRHFEGTEVFFEDFYKPCKKEMEVIEQQSHTVIRLPYYGRKYQLVRKLSTIPFGKEIMLSIYNIFGSLNVQAALYDCAYEFLKEYLSKNEFDYILVTSPPLNSIKLGYKLSKQFDIPLIVDFRDLWDNSLLNENYRPNLRKSLQVFFEVSYLKIWLKRSRLISAISEPILEAVHELNPKAGKLVVMNGFEECLSEKLANFDENNLGKFTFSVIGTIYAHQDMSILLEGMKLFLNDKNLDEIQLNFVGTALMKGVGQKLTDSLPARCTNVTNRLPHEEALKKLGESDVLFYPAWKGYRGVASGKIFEYLGSKKKILIAPGDGDIIEKLVSETGAGEVANSPTEFAEIMNRWFRQWKSSGNIPYSGDYEKALTYSRENQAAKLAEEIIRL